jgi:hypothetical protein
MNMKKSFPFEFEKYIAGTAFMNRREKGAYVDLLCCEADKGPLTLQNIKDILNGDFECWEKIKSKFIEENGLYYNKKLESVKQGKPKKSDEDIAKERIKFELQRKEKLEKFYDDCIPYLGKYPKEMIRQFYNYWTEVNKAGTKLRFELQQTFEIGKRLTTWAGREKDFNKVEKVADAITYNELLHKFNKGEIDIWDKYEQVTPGDKRSLWQLKKQRYDNKVSDNASRL